VNAERRPPFDAVVLAGGRARRLGGVSKPAVDVAGRRLIDRTLDAAAGARAVVVVGPPDVAPPGVRVTREDPPGGGPVAGLAAGLAALPDGAPLVLVLACDLPRVAGASAALLDAAGRAEREGADGAVLLDVAGRRQPLAAAYRRASLDAALARLPSGGAGAAMRDLVRELRLLDVPDDAGYAADVDTPDDLDRARSFADRAWHDDERRAEGRARGGA
jgi:molybdopterin-guanine dinucleotide biosynthesis protein A